MRDWAPPPQTTWKRHWSKVAYLEIKMSCSLYLIEGIWKSLAGKRQLLHCLTECLKFSLFNSPLENFQRLLIRNRTQWLANMLTWTSVSEPLVILWSWKRADFWKKKWNKKFSHLFQKWKSLGKDFPRILWNVAILN